jgi:site-specific recombinase XerD
MPRSRAEAWEHWTVDHPSLPPSDRELARRYLARRRLAVAPATALREQHWICRWGVHCAQAGVSFTTATEEHAVALAQGWASWGWSPAIIRQFLTALRFFHDWLIDQGHSGTRNPWRGLKPPREIVREPRVLDADQVGALLAALCRPHWRDARDRAVLALLFAAGLRVGELVALDLGDLDLAHGVVHVGPGKTKRERTVPLDQTALDALALYLEAVRPVLARSTDARALFLGRHGRRLERTVVADALQRAAARAGLHHHVYPHLLRHSFATDLAEGGADVLVLQRLLGHVSPNSTARYVHMARRRLHEVYKRTHRPPGTPGIPRG